MVKIDFNPKKHTYTINGEVYPSVTTILGIIDKSGPLINWAAKVTAEYIHNNFKEKDGKIFIGDMELNTANAGKLLSRAKKEHNIIKTEAGDIGTHAHAEIEKIIKAAKVPTESVLCAMEPQIANPVRAYLKWAEENHFQPMHSEQRVCLLKHKVAGTIDCVGTLDGKLTLVDFKTSKAIYPEMKLQVAAYTKAWEETFGKKIEQVRILRIGKDKPEFECHTVDNVNFLFSIFLSCIPIYLWRKVENRKKNVAIKIAGVEQ